MPLILTESEVQQLLTMKDGVRLVEESFRQYAGGKTTLAPRLVMKLSGVAGNSGRENDSQITLFKSVGVAIEDVAVAAWVYDQAKERGLGTELALQS